jgi:hypothetical protein
MVVHGNLWISPIDPMADLHVKPREFYDVWGRAYITCRVGKLLYRSNRRPRN